MSVTTTGPIDIFTDTDFYVPAFEVKLNGHKQGGDVVRDVLQVSYKDSLDEIDSFELTVNNWDATQRTFKYSDEDLFAPGAKLELRMGYRGKDALRLMLRGEITSLRPQFPASGQPTLAVSGLNVLHRFRREQETHTYKNMTDTAIARQIADRLGVELVPNPAASQEEKNEFLFQYQQYDILFLLQRARSLGYEVVIVEDEQGGTSKLAFSPSDNPKAVSYKLAYGKSLIQFQPTLTTARQVSEVVVRGWDPLKKEPIEVTVKRSETKTKGSKDEKDAKALEKAFAERTEVVTMPPVQNEKEARKLALARMDQIVKDMIKGSGAVVGLPDLRAGTVLQIGGLGRRFSGRYFVTATSHTLGGGGYTTEFECRKEELNR